MYLGHFNGTVDRPVQNHCRIVCPRHLIAARLDSLAQTLLFVLWKFAKKSPHFATQSGAYMKTTVKPSLFCFASVAGAFIVIIAFCAGLRLIPASRGYVVRAEFADLPASDRKLEEWMRSQPGVVAHTAHVIRDGKALRVGWIMTQNGYRIPRTPDLQTAWRRMGYSTPTNVDWDWRSE